MAQSVPPPYEGDDNESPAKQLVRLLEQHGLEGGLRSILQSLEERRRGHQQRARLELVDELLQGQPPITEQELQQARREWQE